MVCCVSTLDLCSMPQYSPLLLRQRRHRSLYDGSKGGGSVSELRYRTTHEVMCEESVWWEKVQAPQLDDTINQHDRTSTPRGASRAVRSCRQVLPV